MRSTYLALAAVTAFACGDSFIASSGDPSGVGGSATTSANGGQGGSTSNGGAGADCEGTEIVVPDVPPDWNGYTIISSQPDALCPDGSNSEPGYVNLFVPPDCDCGCGTNPQHCFAITGLYGDSLCNTAAIMGPTIYHGTCLANPQDFDGNNAQFTTDFDEGLCAGDAPLLRSLQFDAVSTCDAKVNGDCLEAPGGSFARAVCVSRVGVQTCPDDFPLDFSVGRGLQDTRSCRDDCSCGAQNLECKGEIVFFDDENCANLIGSVSHEVCGPTASNTSSARYDASVSGSCDQVPGSGSYGGQAGVDYTETICCTDS